MLLQSTQKQRGSIFALKMNKFVNCNVWYVKDAKQMFADKTSKKN